MPYACPNSEPKQKRWSGGAMVMGKLPVPGRPTYLDKSRGKGLLRLQYVRLGLFGHFFLPFSGRRSDID